MLLCTAAALAIALSAATGLHSDNIGFFVRTKKSFVMDQRNSPSSSSAVAAATRYFGTHEEDHDEHCNCLHDANMSAISAEERGCHMSPHSGKQICYVDLRCKSATPSKRYKVVKYRECQQRTDTHAHRLENVDANCDCLTDVEGTSIAYTDLGCRTSPWSRKNVCYVDPMCANAEVSQLYAPVRFRECSPGIQRSSTAVATTYNASAGTTQISASSVNINEQNTATTPPISSLGSQSSTIMAEPSSVACECLDSTTVSSIPPEELGCHKSPHSGKDICYVGPDCQPSQQSKRYFPARFVFCVKETYRPSLMTDHAAKTNQTRATEIPMTNAADVLIAAPTFTGECPCAELSDTSNVPPTERECHISPHSGAEICYVAASCTMATESKRHKPLRYRSCSVNAEHSQSLESEAISAHVEPVAVSSNRQSESTSDLLPISEQLSALDKKLEKVMDQVLQLKQIATTGTDALMLKSEHLENRSDGNSNNRSLTAVTPSLVAAVDSKREKSINPFSKLYFDSANAPPTANATNNTATGVTDGVNVSRNAIVRSNESKVEQVEDGLVEVNRYHQQGLLTDQEYEKARSDIDKMLMDEQPLLTSPVEHKMLQQQNSSQTNHSTSDLSFVSSVASEMEKSMETNEDVAVRQNSTTDVEENAEDLRTWADDDKGFPIPLTPEDVAKLD
eukprot:SAG31_NODE_3763_length_3905_cov_1.693379_2_plen_680_part_00